MRKRVSVCPLRAQCEGPSESPEGPPQEPAVWAPALGCSLENCEKISIRASEPPSLWHLAVAAWADEGTCHQQMGQNVKDFHFAERQVGVGQPLSTGMNMHLGFKSDFRKHQRDKPVAFI